MSSYEPSKPYVYQPDPVSSPNFPRIYALAGPGVPKEFEGKRFTKADAYEVLDLILRHWKSRPTTERTEHE